MTIIKARKLLGKSASKFSDEEIETLITNFSTLAEVLISVFGSNNKSMGIETQIKKEDYEHN